MSHPEQDDFERANESLHEDNPLFEYMDPTGTASSDSTESPSDERIDLNTANENGMLDESLGLKLGELHPTLIRASAGSGKTYQLTARLLRILLMGAPPESILATTFTRKAAGEILERVLMTLAEAADESNEKALCELRDQVELQGLRRSTCVSLLDRLIRSIHRLRICTLDALFSQIARSFPFELNLPPAWRLTDEIEEGWIRRAASSQMIAALDHTEMILLLSMLGKGEVKRSVTREVMGVVESAYGVSRMAPDKAWVNLKANKMPKDADLTEAVGLMLAATPKQASLKKKLAAVGAALDSRQFEGLGSERLVHNIAKARRNGDPVKLGRSVFPDGLDDAFDVLYAVARCETLRLLAAQNEATSGVLSSYDFHVRELKQASRAIGFQDVVTRLAEHFASLDPHAIAMRMDGAVDHLLLDEFQDTAPLQWQILRPFAMGCVQNDSTGDRQNAESIARSFFCVGDTKQAIYGWRGGVAEIFDNVAAEIDGVEEISQNKSFRSSPVIMDAINATFPRIDRHSIAHPVAASDVDSEFYIARSVCQFAQRFPKHVTARQGVPGYAELVTADVSDGNAEAKREKCFEAAANLVAQLQANAPTCRIGILTRSNAAIGSLIHHLERLGVEASQEGGNPLTDSKAVELILSALMMAEHPGDKRWAFHVAGSPLSCIEGIGPSWVRQKVDDLGIAETIECLASKLATSCDARDTLRLKQLTRLAIQYEPNATDRLRDFVDLVRNKRVERPQEALVRVMTIHQSKGLEFDAVVLPQLDGDLTKYSSKPVAMLERAGDIPVGLSRNISKELWHFLPPKWRQAFGGSVEASMTEALCLLYVAMTRAKQALHMIVSPTKKDTFDLKTPGSLIYQALGCDEDPSEGEKTLWSIGESDWYSKS